MPVDFEVSILCRVPPLYLVKLKIVNVGGIEPVANGLVVRLPSVLLGGSLVSFSRVECVEHCVPRFSALTALQVTLLLLPSRDPTGSPSRGEDDSVHLCWLWGERSFHASWRGAAGWLSFLQLFGSMLGRGASSLHDESVRAHSCC